MIVFVLKENLIPAYFEEGERRGRDSERERQRDNLLSKKFEL
jgi:hypothetical protein